MRENQNEEEIREDSCKIFLVDDHALFREGLKGLLESCSNGKCRVVNEAENGKEFLELLPHSDADVVLLDIDMPKVDGFEATRSALELRPELKIITLSMHGDEDYYFKMVSLGVKGFLLKSSEIDEVLTAIETVNDGGSYFSQELLQDLLGNLKSSKKEEEEKSTLSERESEILLLICKGFSNQEIADQLFISKRTVDKHRANILEKTGAKNTANLVVYAIKNELVEI